MAAACMEVLPALLALASTAPEAGASPHLVLVLQLLLSPPAPDALRPREAITAIAEALALHTGLL